MQDRCPYARDPRRSGRRARRLWRRGGAAVLSGVLAFQSLAGADSITVDGVTLDDVYIREGISIYYIYCPENGTVRAVTKNNVDKGDVHISKSTKERRALLAKWKEQRAVNLPAAKSTALLPPAPLVPPRDDAKARIKPGPEILTNLSSSERAHRQNRPVFLDPSGVPVLTNKPDKYRGRGDHIELTVQYATIEVPARFRGAKSKPITAPEDLREIVRHYCGLYRLDENLVLAVMKAESNFDPVAVSPAGARGLMQLMPGTAAEMGVTDLFDPAQNIAGGTQYLSKMLGLFDGDLTLALAAYNAGPGAVAKYNGIPPYKETRAYVQRVRGYLNGFQGQDRPQLRLAAAARPNADYLPSQTAYRFLIHFRNGFTQPAEAIETVDDAHYIVQYKGLTTRIRKADVREIKETA